MINLKNKFKECSGGAYKICSMVQTDMSKAITIQIYPLLANQCIIMLLSLLMFHALSSPDLDS